MPPADRVDRGSRRLVVRFLVVFAGLVIVLSLLVRADWFNNAVLSRYTGLISSIAGVLLGWIGVPVSVVGTAIRHSAFSVDIKKGCDGMEATLLLVCATIAYPFRTSRYRWLALGSGYIVIFVLNMIRVVTLFLLGVKGAMQAFNFVHTYVAQFVVVLAVMILWLFWVSVDRPKADAARGDGSVPRAENAGNR